MLLLKNAINDRLDSYDKEYAITEFVTKRYIQFDLHLGNTNDLIQQILKQLLHLNTKIIT